MYGYPYGDTSQLNLDWLIQSWREYQNQVESMIAPAYRTDQTYAVGDLVIYQHGLYQCVTAVTTPEDWKLSKWHSVSLSELL